MQRGSEDTEKGLGGVAPIFKWNPDNVASTLEKTAEDNLRISHVSTHVLAN
jgi:hypothetical protein